MEYNNQQVRRQDRLLDKASATELLKNGEYGFLSMVSEDGFGYGVPINYVWNQADAIYIHCAPEGQKLLSIAHCDRVSFCVVGHTQVVPNKFTTRYESIILKCIAKTHLSTEEKMKALDSFLNKYAPNDKETGLKYAEKSFHRTEIIRLDIKNWSGKCKIVK